jgi:uncharacterized membrane protein
MEIRAPLVISLAVIAGMLAATAWAWLLIPDGANIAVHWNASGVPDGFAHKPMALLVMPALAAVTTAFFAIAPFFTRHRTNLEKSAKAYTVGWLGTLLLAAVGHLLIIMHARGYGVDVVGNSTFILAMFLVVLGNLLGKTYPNPYVGVRTPWTRKSDYSWEMTHRATGKMLVALGLVTLATMAVADCLLAGRVLICGMFAAAAVSIALSYFYYRHDPRRGNMN